MDQTQFPENDLSEVRSESAPSRSRGAESVRSEGGGVKKDSPFSAVLFWLLSGAIFALPVFFLPIFGVPIHASKSLFVLVSAFSLFLLYLISKLNDGEIALPKTPVVWLFAALPFVYLLSGLFSHTPGFALLGRGFVTDSFLLVTAFSLLAYLSAVLFQTKKRLGSFFVMFGASVLLVSLFQLGRLLFGPESLSFGYFSTPLSNLLGGWFNFAIFFGLVAVVALASFQFLFRNSAARGILLAVLAVSLFFLAVIHLPIVWKTLAVFSLLIAAFTMFLSGGEQSERSGISLSWQELALPFVVFACSLLFIFAGSGINERLAQRFELGVFQEVRPTWTDTSLVVKNTLTEAPILGAGPGTFFQQWVMHRPTDTFERNLWNTDFSTGAGFIPSTLVTVGGAGFLVWFLLWLGAVYSGVRPFWLTMKGGRSDTNVFVGLTIPLAIGTLYLWTMLMLYPPSVVTLALAFVFFGVLLGALVTEKIVSIQRYAFLKDSRIGFVAVLSMVLLMIFSASGIYVSAQKYRAVVHTQKGVVALHRDGDLDEAERRVRLAHALESNDIHSRNIAEVKMLQLRQLISRTDLSEDALVSEFDEKMQEVISQAQSAIDMDERNYQNHLALGNIYLFLATLGVNGSYDEALKSYENVLALAPNSPVVHLQLAHLAYVSERNEEAQQYIQKALDVRQGYTEALTLLSRIQIDEGNMADAITSMEVASLVEFVNFDLWFQLGYLKYHEEDYAGAIVAFENAVLLNPVFANAKYFLGLSYEKTGRIDDAIAQFEDLDTLNPNHSEVQNVLARLRTIRDGGEVVINEEEDEESEIDDDPFLTEGSEFEEEFINEEEEESVNENEEDLF